MVNINDTDDNYENRNIVTRCHDFLVVFLELFIRNRN